jgi:hypothetical protein
MAASPYHVAGIAAICPAAYHVFVILGRRRRNPERYPQRDGGAAANANGREAPLAAALDAMSTY